MPKKFVEFWDERGQYIYNTSFIRSIERALGSTDCRFYIEFSDSTVRHYDFKDEYDMITAFNHILKSLIN